MTLLMTERVTDSAGLVWTRRPDGGWFAVPPDPAPPTSFAEAMKRLAAEQGTPQPEPACQRFVRRFLAVIDGSDVWKPETDSWRLGSKDARLRRLHTLRVFLFEHAKAHREFQGLTSTLIHRLLQGGYSTRKEVAHSPDAEVLENAKISATTLRRIRAIAPIDPDMKWEQERVACPVCGGAGRLHPDELADW